MEPDKVPVENIRMPAQYDEYARIPENDPNRELKVKLSKEATERLMAQRAERKEKEDKIMVPALIVFYPLTAPLSRLRPLPSLHPVASEFCFPHSARPLARPWANVHLPRPAPHRLTSTLVWRVSRRLTPSTSRLTATRMRTRRSE